LFVGHF
jgi:hypothetical protein